MEKPLVGVMQSLPEELGGAEWSLNLTRLALLTLVCSEQDEPVSLLVRVMELVLPLELGRPTVWTCFFKMPTRGGRGWSPRPTLASRLAELAGLLASLGTFGMGSGTFLPFDRLSLVPTFRAAGSRVGIESGMA